MSNHIQQNAMDLLTDPFVINPLLAVEFGSVSPELTTTKISACLSFYHVYRSVRLLIHMSLYHLQSNSEYNCFKTTMHYNEVTWAAWHLKSSTTQLFVKYIAPVYIKENIASYYRPFVKSTGDRWIPQSVSMPFTHHHCCLCELFTGIAWHDMRRYLVDNKQRCLGRTQ